MVGSASPIASPIRWGRCRGWGSAPSRSWRPSNQTTDGRVDVQTVVLGSAAVVDYFAGRGGGATGGNRDKVAELGTSDHCDAKPAPRPGRLHHELLPSNRSWRAFNILTSISCSGGHGAQPLGPGWPARRLPAGEYSPAQPPWQRGAVMVPGEVGEMRADIALLEHQLAATMLHVDLPPLPPWIDIDVTADGASGGALAS